MQVFIILYCKGELILKNLKKILAVLSAVTLVTLTGCGKKNDNSNKITYYDASNPYSQKAEGVDSSGGKSYDENTAAENISTIPAKLNENIDLSGINITLKNVYNAGETETGENPGYKKQVLALNCDITNNTDSKITVNSFNFSIRYIDGESVLIETGMREIMTAGRKITNINQLNSEIAPGKTVSGFASLSVEPDWETITIYFTPLNAKTNNAVTFEITKDQIEEP